MKTFKANIRVIMIRSSRKNNNREGTKSIFRHFCPGLPVSLTLLLINPLNAELNPFCYLLALLAHHFLHVGRIRVKSLKSYVGHCLDVMRRTHRMLP